MKEFLDNQNLWPLNDIFKSLVERAKISITYYSPDNGKILLINKTAARAVSSTPKELENKTIYEIYPQFAKDIKERTEEIMENRDEIITKDFIKPTEQTGFWFESSYAPIFNKDQKLYAIQITSNDISSRIEAEKDMEIMQQNLFEQYMREKTLKELLKVQTTDVSIEEKLQESLHIIFGVHWLENALKGCFFIVHSNGNMQKVATYHSDKYSPEELGVCCTEIPVGDGLCGQVAKTQQELIPEDIEGECSQTVKSGCLNFDQYIFPVNYEDVTEGVFAINVNKSKPLRNQDLAFLRAACSIVGIMVRSEKDKKQIEQHRTNLISSSKLASLGEMASGIAHEINNPLTIINGYAKLLMNAAKRQDENINELMLQILPQIDETVGRISSIIQGLQNFSRDGSKDEREIKALRSIIDKTLTFCHKKFSHHSINIEVNFKPEDIQIYCSETQLSQVFLNLLNNSFGAIKELEEKWVTIDALVEDNLVILTFTDCGKGIPEDIQEKILEPFFTTKDPNSGTGLGLSISTTIVENHGGILRYKKHSPNTAFEIRLPIVK